MDDVPNTSANLNADPNATCERCGRFGAFNVAGQWLCASCYEASGSCCPEFGADDLWAERGKNRRED